MKIACRLVAVLAGVLVLVLAAVVLLQRTKMPTQWPSPLVLAIAIGLGVGFVGFKALALRQCAKLAGLSVALRDSARLLCEGVAVECLSWPGKLWADGYRARMLGTGPLGSRVRALVVFRLASVVAVVIGLASAAVAIDGVSWGDGLLLMMVVAFVGVAVALRARRRGFVSLSQVSGVVLTVLYSLGALAVDTAAASLIAWSLAGVDPLAFAACFVVCGVLASASGVPLGIGVLDAAGWVVLTGFFGVDAQTAAAVVVAHRVCGPLMTVLAGALMLMLRGLPDLELRVPRVPRVPSQRMGRRRSLAFSLVELVLVVMIIGVISAIAVPRFVSTTDNAYRAAAVKLDQALEKGVLLYLKDYGKMPQNFKNWVGMNKHGTSSNYINLQDLRSLAKDPDQNIRIDPNTLRIEFKSGLVVEYRIDSSGNLSSTYTEPVP